MVELETQLTVLENNNNELRNLLMQSNQNLMRAGEQSTILTEQIEMLNKQLAESATQIKNLRNQLIEAQKSTSEAKNSLEIANKELDEAAKSLKKSDKQLRSLKFKNSVLKVAVFGLVGVLVTRGN